MDFPCANGKWFTWYCLWCWYGWSEVHFKKHRAPKEHASCNLHQYKSCYLISFGSRSLQNSFLVQWFFLSKCGTFVGKCYEYGGLFHLALLDVCNKVVNHIYANIETNVWHSRLCHVNFSCMTHIAKMNLIPSFTNVKGSKCQLCVRLSTSRTHTFKSLRKDGKKYFMMFIDDSIRYFYVHLLKTNMRH
jgi:hypothetical protein